MNTWADSSFLACGWLGEGEAAGSAVLLVNLVWCTVTGLTDTGEEMVCIEVVGMTWGSSPWLPIMWVPCGVWTMVWK